MLGNFLINFFSYLLSFYIIGLYWLILHWYFRYSIKFDTGLFFMNLTLLLFIAFCCVAQQAHQYKCRCEGLSRLLRNCCQQYLPGIAFSYSYVPTSHLVLLVAHAPHSS